MTERTINNSSKTSSQKKITKKGENIKIKILSNTDKILTTFELRPKKFASGSRGYYGTTKSIWWDQKKYLQITAYAVEIGSKANSKTKVEQADRPNKQQDQLD